MTNPLRIRRPVSRRTAVTTGAIAVLLVAMVFGTKIMTGDGTTSADRGTFSAVKFAKDKYASAILPAIEKRATDVVTVSTAIAADSAAASTKYGVVEGSSPPVYSVTMTGVAGAVEDGIMPVVVAGMPAGTGIRVQMGPAINGTALRDASGTVHFPQFTNQIEYQNAGSELNNIIKKTVLSGVDVAGLVGKTVTMTGVFQLINPQSFLVTPVKFRVGA